MKSVDREAAKIAIEQLEMGDDALRKLLRIFHKVSSDERPVFAGGIFDAGESGNLLVRHVGQCTQGGAGSTRRNGNWSLVNQLAPNLAKPKPNLVAIAHHAARRVGFFHSPSQVEVSG